MPVTSHFVCCFIRASFQPEELLIKSRNIYIILDRIGNFAFPEELFPLKRLSVVRGSTGFTAALLGFYFPCLIENAIQKNLSRRQNCDDGCHCCVNVDRNGFMSELFPAMSWTNIQILIGFCFAHPWPSTLFVITECISQCENWHIYVIWT